MLEQKVVFAVDWSLESLRILDPFPKKEAVVLNSPIKIATKIYYFLKKIEKIIVLSGLKKVSAV